MNLENLIHKGKKAITKTICAGLAASTLLLTGCPMPIIPTPIPEPITGELSENTKILTTGEASQISSITDNQITFSQSENYTAGDIIVSGISANAPDGLLREVIGASGDGTIVYTQSTTLEDAIKNLTFATDKKISKDIIINSGISLVNFNLAADVFYQEAVDIHGSIDFSSDLVFEINIQDHHLNKLLIKNVIDESSSVNLTAGFSLDNIAPQEFQLAPPCRLSPFVIYLPTVPPFPIIITPKLEVVAGIEGGISTTPIRVTQSLNSELGIDYENGSWNIIKNIHISPPGYSMAFANVANLKAYVGPKLDFLIYGAAGPYANLRGYLNLETNTNRSYLDLYGGLEAILGVNMKLFSNTIFDFSTSMLDFSWLVKSWGDHTSVQKTVKIQPGSEGKDTYLSRLHYNSTNSSANVNDGSNINLKIDNYSSVDGTDIAKSFIEFPISSIPSGATINSAKLKLFGTQNSSFYNMLVILKRITQPWDEYFGNDGPSYDNTNIASSSLTGSAQWYEWNVTSLVQSWMNGAPNYGMVITSGNRNAGSLYTDSYSFYSSDYYSEPSKHPILEVTYTQ